MLTILTQKFRQINPIDPIARVKDTMTTHYHVRRLENLCNDFDIDTFHFQAREIYDDIRNAVLNKEFPILARSLHDRLFVVRLVDVK
jgi:hypothetical protein